MSKPAYATMTFRVVDSATPLVYAFQAARLAVIEAVARREHDKAPDEMTISQPANGLLMVTAYPDRLSAILDELEKAQVFAPVVLEVSRDGRPASQTDAEDVAEYIRDRTDQVVVISRPARGFPAS